MQAGDEVHVNSSGVHPVNQGSISHFTKNIPSWMNQTYHEWISVAHKHSHWSFEKPLTISFNVFRVFPKHDTREIYYRAETL